MKKILTISVLGVSALAMMTANAATTSNSSPITTTNRVDISSISSPSIANTFKSGVYITGQLGYADTNLDNKTNFTDTNFTPNNSSDTNLSNNGFAGRLAIGYQFNPYLAIETGYLQLGSTAVNGTVEKQPLKLKLRENAFDLVGKGIYPICDNFNIYAKAGIAYLTTKVSAHTDATITSASNLPGNNLNKDTLAPEVGVGLSYNLASNIAVDTSWTHIQTLNNRQGNVDFAAVGLNYYFG